MNILVFFFGVTGMVRGHPFWNRGFRRHFGIAGEFVAVALWITASLIVLPLFRGLGIPGYFVAFIATVLPVPCFATPICCSWRLFVMLLSVDWRRVADWAATLAVALTLCALGFVVSENWNLICFAAAATMYSAFSVLAYERECGKIAPEPL